MVKIVYLLGAGASHAEIMNLEDNPDATFKDNNGLLISDVSSRVMKRAHKINSWFKKYEDVFTSTKGSFNIELLISLFETNQIPDYIISSLKKLVQEDIKKRLSPSRKKKFYLHKALFELHLLIEETENLLGIISLNYDDVLDEACEHLLGKRPNYCLTSERDDGLPVLKLHGSFNWNRIKIYGKSKNISIIPIGINKNYLAPPYNFIWGRAFELLVKCDILRIIGCSLNQNDVGLIDLLFKAHFERRSKIKIEIIDFQPIDSDHSIKTNYGFFTGIINPLNIEDTLITDTSISKYDVGNPFKIWLKAKAEKMLPDRINHTKYIKKCL